MTHTRIRLRAQEIYRKTGSSVQLKVGQIESWADWKLNCAKSAYWYRCNVIMHRHNPLKGVFHGSVSAPLVTPAGGTAAEKASRRPLSTGNTPISNPNWNYYYLVNVQQRHSATPLLTMLVAGSLAGWPAYLMLKSGLNNKGRVEYVQV